MRRTPGLVGSGGGGVSGGATSGQFQYNGRLLRWANPVRWDTARYTKAVIDLWAASQPVVVVSILNARDGDRLICSFTMSDWGSAAQTITFPGVNIGAATVNDRVNAACQQDPRTSYLYQPGQLYWADCMFFFMKTRGQLYLSRVLWRCPGWPTLYPE